MKTNFLFKLCFVVAFLIGLPKTHGQITTSDLLEDTYSLYDIQRQYNGVYRDSKIINGADYHPCSAANTGVGLISLCVADQAGYITYAKDLAVQTLRTMLGYTSGFNPDRNSNGYYRHFLDIDTGNQAWNSEYSTIDTALLAAGALFAKKYFNDNEVSALADELFLSIDWGASIANASTGAIWRELDSSGNGQGTSALPFNEYMIVAYLAMKAEGNSPGNATTAWNVWQQLGNFADANYWGYTLLTDDDTGNAFLSDFTIQFPYYLISWAHNSTAYNNYMNNMASADKLYFQNISGNYPNLSSYEWGLGAGNSPATFNGTTYTAYGYNADRINVHPAHVVSPHILAGYIPVSGGAKSDFLQLLSSNKGVYTLNSGEELVWRYSLDEPTWNSDQIQGIDYSTMLYGLAADQFGTSFFTNNNNYDFPVKNFQSAGSCSGSVTEISGAVLGSPGSWDGTSTRDKAFDNRNWTYFDAPTGNNQWVGLDLGSYQNITCIRFRPRKNFAYRMRGGKFQISDNANFSNPRTIYTIPTNASLGFQNYFVNSGGADGVYARYIRYLSPNNGFGNIAEMDVYVSSATNRTAENSGKDLSDSNYNSVDEFVLSPNPASNYFEVKFPVRNQQSIDYKVFNLQGKVIQSFSKKYNQKGYINERVDVEGLSDGIYFIQFRTESEVYKKRFIVIK